MVAVKVDLDSSISLMNVLESVSGMDVEIHIYVDNGLFSVYEAFAVYDILTNLYKGEREKLKIFYRQSNSFVNLIVGSAVPKENRFVFKHYFSFCHSLAGFGYGSYKDLEVLAEQMEKDTDTLKEIVSAGWNISLDDIDELMKESNRLVGSKLLEMGAEPMSLEAISGVTYEEPMSLRAKLVAILKDTASTPEEVSKAKELLNEA